MLHNVNLKWHVRSTLRHTQPFCKVDFTKCKYLTFFYIIIWSIQKKAVPLHREIKKTNQKCFTYSRLGFIHK